ncbi:Kinesin light chain 3 [Blyttiomyces sp. JEL0837]|nr:Kinesin light chain 3 [Blyttiomyces sp. JEL0837]
MTMSVTKDHIGPLDVKLLPQLATIGFVNTHFKNDEIIDQDRRMIYSKKEHRAIPTWGINLQYLIEFIKACGGRDSFTSLTTADVCSLFVKPLTAHHQGSVCEILIDSDRHDAAQKANWFVSHAWQCNFLDMVDALSSFFKDQNTNFEKIFLWIDLFCLSQHKEEDKPFEWWQNTFMMAVKSIKNVVMVLDPWHDPIPLKRSWCILEVLACDLGIGRFHVALSPKENDRLLKDLQDEYSHAGMLSRVSSEKSESTSEDDRIKIFEIITATTSFRELDRLVLNTYNAALTRRLEQQYEKMVQCGSVLDIIPAQLALVTFKLSSSQFQDAKNLSEDALKRCENELDRDHPTTITALLSLGSANYSLADAPVSEKIFLDCLDRCLGNPNIGNHHVLTIKTRLNLARVYNSVRDNSKAQVHATDAMEACTALLGSDHILTATVSGLLGLLESTMGNYEKAENLLMPTLEISSRLRGDDHPETLRLAETLGTVYWQTGKLSEGKDLLVDLLSRQMRLVGPNHIDTLKSLVALGSLYDRMGLYEQSEPLKVEAYERFLELYGPDHPNTSVTMNNLASLYTKMGQLDKAEGLILKCLEGLNRTLGPEKTKTVAAYRTLGSLYLRQDKIVKAHETYFNAWTACKEQSGLDFGETLRLQVAVGQTFSIQGEYVRAEEIFMDSIERMERVFGSESVDTLFACRKYGDMLNWRGDYEKAVDLLEGNLVKMENALGKDHAETVACVRVLSCSVDKQYCPFMM